MPIKSCTGDGKKPGFKYGDSGKCYTYTPNNEASRKKAKKKAIYQGIRIAGGPEKFQQEMKSGALELDQDILADLIYDNNTPTEILDDLLKQYKPINILDHVNAIEYVLAKKMSRQEINDLPDSDFAFIEDGGKKDESGKTVPRSLRHFPIHDAAHVKNALARLSQSNLTPEQKTKAKKKILAAAKKFGIKVNE